jgi:hypothetical protein
LDEGLGMEFKGGGGGRQSYHMNRLDFLHNRQSFTKTIQRLSLFQSQRTGLSVKGQKKEPSVLMWRSLLKSQIPIVAASR